VRKEDIKVALSGLQAELFPLGDHASLVSKLFDVSTLEHADPLVVLRAELASSMKHLSAMEAELGQHTEERAAALRNENVVAAEQRTSTILKLLTDILAEVAARRQTAAAAGGEVDAHASAVSQAKSTMPESLEALHSAQVALADKCAADRQRLVGHRQLFEEKHQAASAAFHQNLSSFRADLDANNVAQKAVWDEVFKALAKLDVLRQQRAEKLVSRVAAVQAETHRVAVHNATEEAIAQAVRRCDSVEQTARRAASMASATRAYMEEAFRHVEHRKWAEKQQTAMLEESIRFYESYKRFSQLTGELIHRGEQRLENTKRLVRSVEFQVKLATESLDTELPAYREQLQRAQKTQAELHARLAEYRAAEERERLQWQEVETVLEKHDVDFDPPELLVQQLQRDLLEAHLTAVDELTNEEQKLLDHEKRQVRTMHNLCDATKANLEERKAARIAAHAHRAP